MLYSQSRFREKIVLATIGVCLLLYFIQDGFLYQKVSDSDQEFPSLIHSNQYTNSERSLRRLGINDTTKRRYYLIVDGIIFQMQRSNPKGISTVWKNLLSQLAQEFNGDDRLYFLDPCPDNPYTAELAHVENLNYIPRHQSIQETIQKEIINDLDPYTQGDDAGVILVFISTYYDYPELSELCNIIMYHDLIPENVGMDTGPYTEYYPRISILDRIASVISVSEATSRDILKWYGDKVRLSESDIQQEDTDTDNYEDDVTKNTIISTIQNRISRDVFPGIATSEQIMQVRSKYKFPSVKDPAYVKNGTLIDYFVTVGSAHSYKNSKYMFAALDLLPDDVLQKFWILMIGRSEPTEQELSYISNHPVVITENDHQRKVVSSRDGKSHVPIRFKIVVYMDLKDLPATYSGSLGLIYISQYEGFGLPLAEALTSGTLAVTHNSSSLPEVGGSAPIYVQNAQDPSQVAAAMTKLLSLSAEERDLRIQSGRKYVERFGGGGDDGIGHGWEEMASQIADHIRNSTKHRSQQCYYPQYSVSTSIR
ncbi:hypothetical protein MIR68_006891 [Amoeboaphelidium protococcarum]|nr:hypothetical protein MIR68_006891 [Amoeboaphelidium protococcarum]